MIAVDSAVLDGIQKGCSWGEFDPHALHRSNGNPRFDASPPGLSVIPVRIREIRPEDFHDLHAFPDGISNSHRHPIIQVWFPKNRDGNLRDFIQGIIVGIRDHVRVSDRRNDRGPPFPKDFKETGLEVFLMFQIIHPENDIRMEDVGRHVYRPIFVNPILLCFLRKGVLEDIGD